ncbi:hypothetical protein F4680DRAFT_405513 [Xylaria scruposa]|nr:hypothetical protein F4680DRAFT_405513 [Xylaria scruposa]
MRGVRVGVMKTTIFLITGDFGTGYLPPLCRTTYTLWFLDGYYVFFPNIFYCSIFSLNSFGVGLSHSR